MNYAHFFAAYKAAKAAGNPLTREEVILDFTGGRTNSLKQCPLQEINQMADLLNKQAGKKAPPPADDKADRMRKAIISIFYKMNKNAADAKAWAEKQGVAGIKKPFNDYTTQELFTLISVAEKVLADHNSVIRKNLQAL